MGRLLPVRAPARHSLRAPGTRTLIPFLGSSDLCMVVSGLVLPGQREMIWLGLLTELGR